MAYVLEIWNTSTETWDDISDKSSGINPDVHLDIFGIRYITYNGVTMELDADSLTIVNGDYIRYRTDDANSYYENMIYDVDSTMDSVGNWVADDGSFDINVTVAGKMYATAPDASFASFKIDLPFMLAAGKRYKVVFKARHNSGTAREWRFGESGMASGSYYGVTIDNGTEATFTGYFTATKADKFYIFSESVANAHNIEIDDVELYVESEPVIFSGYVSNLKKIIRLNKWTFDLSHEVAFLLNQSISRTLSGSDLRQRLMDAMPSGYALVEMDNIAKTSLDIAPSGYGGITYPGETVEGTDANTYRCFLDHVADAANRPITGTWAPYWELNGSGGGDWVLGNDYKSMHFSDVLFDTLLIMNANDSGGNYIRFCEIVNKEIRIYGDRITGGWNAIPDANISEIERAYIEETVLVNYLDLANDELKGTGSISWGAYNSIIWEMKVHKFTVVNAEYGLMAQRGYGSSFGGFITGIEKKGLKYIYEITEISQA